MRLGTGTSPHVAVSPAPCPTLLRRTRGRNPLCTVRALARWSGGYPWPQPECWRWSRSTRSLPRSRTMLRWWLAADRVGRACPERCGSRVGETTEDPPADPTCQGGSPATFPAGLAPGVEGPAPPLAREAPPECACHTVVSSISRVSAGHADNALGRVAELQSCNCVRFGWTYQDELQRCELRHIGAIRPVQIGASRAELHGCQLGGYRGELDRDKPGHSGAIHIPSRGMRLSPDRLSEFHQLVRKCRGGFARE